MEFYYEAKNKAGDTIAGVIDAPDKEEAAYQLYKKKLEVLKLERKRKEGRVGERDLILFTRVLSNGVEAKIPLVKALEITLQELPGKSPLRKLSVAVLSEIRAGKQLSDAMAQHPSVFPTYYVSLVRAGEKSGKLFKSLAQVLSLLGRSYEVRRKVLSALLYPVFVLSFGVVVLFFFTNVIIPRFQQSYREMGGELPSFTRAVVGVTAWFNSNAIWLLPLIALAVFGLYRWTKTENGRLAYERVLLKIPVVGDLVGKNAVVQFSRAFSSLLGGGVTITDSLELVKNVVRLKCFQVLIQEAGAGLAEGKKLSEAFRNADFIPAGLVQMLGMGEESGKLAELTGYLSDFYEKELDVSVERITSLLTPVLIVCIGLIVGIIAVALFLPIIEISSIVR